MCVFYIYMNTHIYVLYVFMSVCIYIIYNMQYCRSSFNVRTIHSNIEMKRIIQVERWTWHIQRNSSVRVGSYHFIIICWGLSMKCYQRSIKFKKYQTLTLRCVWSSWRVKFNTRLNQCNGKNLLHWIWLWKVWGGRDQGGREALSRNQELMEIKLFLRWKGQKIKGPGEWLGMVRCIVWMRKVEMK